MRVVTDVNPTQEPLMHSELTARSRWICGTRSGVSWRGSGVATRNSGMCSSSMTPSVALWQGNLTASLPVRFSVGLTSFRWPGAETPETPTGNDATPSRAHA